MNSLFIICGTPGSGKTTYARMLAAEKYATVLDIDNVSERLVRVALAESGHSPDDRDSDYFKHTWREPIYEALFDVARENLSFQDVIIAGPFTREINDPGWPVRLAKHVAGEVEVHYVQCPPDVRKARLAKRGDARDISKLGDWDNYIQYYGDERPPVFDHVLVDGTGNTMFRSK